MLREWRWLAIALLAAVHPPLDPPSEKPPTNRWVDAVSVQEVLVPVVVREVLPGSGVGRPVSGLTATDFSVIEDGVVQPIASFSTEPLPAALVVAVDTSPSMEGYLWSVKKSVADFALARPEGASLSLLSFNDQVYLQEGFTHDVEKIARAASILRAGGSRTALWEAVRYGARHLAGRPGPRALILFTDGEDSLDEEGKDVGRRRIALETAQASDVTVFAIAWGRADLSALEQVALPTGGEAMTARSAKELTEAFRRIGESLGNRYILGYAPPAPDRMGERRIEVRVGRSGVQVFARSGYTLSASPATP